MPNPRISKHEFRKVSGEPKAFKDDDTNSFGFRDGRISIRIIPTGAQIHGRAKASVEDGAALDESGSNDGQSELVVEVSDCDCNEFKGSITVRAVHKLYYTARLAQMTISSVSVTGVADSLGEKTTLTLDIDTAQVEAGTDTHTNENGEQVKVSAEGEATGEVEGVDVKGKGNVEFNTASTTTTELKRTVTQANAKADTGTVIKTFTKTFPLHCGPNRFPAQSSLVMALTSAVQRNADGSEKSTAPLKSRVVFDIENKLEAESITFTDCDGNVQQIQIPGLTVASADRVVTDGLVAATQFANVPEVLVSGREEEFDDALVVLRHPQDIEATIRSSNPAVLDVVEPRFVLPVGVTERPLRFRPLKPGSAKITLSLPDLNFERVQTVNVVDFGDLRETVTVQPQAIEVAQGGIAIVDIFRVLSPQFEKGANFEIEIADRDLIRIADKGNFADFRADSYLGIVGEQPGSTAISLRRRGAKESMVLPVEVIPQGGIRLQGATRLSLQPGEASALFMRTSHALLRPVSIDVQVSAEHVLCPATRTIIIPPQQRSGVVLLSGHDVGRAMLTLATDFGALHCVDVRVAEPTAIPC